MKTNFKNFKWFVYALLLILIAGSGDTFATNKIDNQCDLKAYALSRVGSGAYRIYQGFVLGRTAPTEFCQYRGDTGELLLRIRQELRNTKCDCSIKAADYVDSFVVGNWSCL